MRVNNNGYNHQCLQNSDCENLGKCIASNDDGCADPTQTLSTVSLEVVAGVPYYFEVRTYGNSPPAPLSITFYFFF